MGGGAMTDKDIDVMSEQAKKFEDAKSQAFHWIACLEDADATDAEHAAFADWLYTDPLHEAAWNDVDGFARMVSVNAPLLEDMLGQCKKQQVAETVPDLTDVSQKTVDRTVGGNTDQTVHSFAAEAEKRKSASSDKTYGKGIVRFAMAAAVGGLAWFGANMLQPGMPTADHISPVGKISEFVLSDGSIVTLASNSALSVDYSEGQRKLSLVRGEAYFDVASDPKRPFVVSAGARNVKALGTEFDVRIEDEMVAVTVAEHSVDVFRPDDIAVSSDHQVIEEGFGVTYDPQGISTPVKQNLHHVLAWRQGRLIFHQATLGDVIKRLDEYCKQKLLVFDPEVKGHLISASLDVRDPEKALRSLIRGFNLRTVEWSDRILVVTGRGA